MCEQTNTNVSYRFKSIKVPFPRQVFICEHLNNSVMPENSRIYCGICGHQVGTTTKELIFPFDVSDFVKNLKDIRFNVMVLGLVHLHCGALFPRAGNWGFFSLRELFEYTKPTRETERLLKSIPEVDDHETGII